MRPDCLVTHQLRSDDEQGRSRLPSGKAGGKGKKSASLVPSGPRRPNLRQRLLMCGCAIWRCPLNTVRGIRGLGRRCLSCVVGCFGRCVEGLRDRYSSWQMAWAGNQEERLRRKMRFLLWAHTTKKIIENRRNMQRSLHHLVHRKTHLCWNTWHAYAVAAVLARHRMELAIRALLNAPQKIVFNTWMNWWEERVAAKARLEEIAAKYSPEGRAKRRGFKVLAELAAVMQKMRRGMSVFKNAKLIAVLNTWHEQVVEAQERAQRQRKALARMSPEGRAKLKVIEKLQDIARAAHALERAVRAFMNAAPRKAFNTWKQLEQVKMQGLKNTVWLAAQRGQRVGSLQDMFEALEPSVVDELLHAHDETGMTPLLWAAKRGYGDVAEVLLAFAEDRRELMHAQDSDGSTPLHHAARRGHNEIVELLVLHEAQVNATNSDLSTPLHWAARKNNTGAIKMLLEAGADAGLMNKWGATALDNAKFADHHAAIQQLSRDPAEIRAAQSRLILEQKLRPTEEEREAKLAELAADALHRREDARARMHALTTAREAAEMKAKESAQLEKGMRAADNRLAAALAPASTKKAGSHTSQGMPWLDFTAEEAAILEKCIAKAVEEGNMNNLVFAERCRQGVSLLAKIKAAQIGNAITVRGQSHRSPSKSPQESPVERTLRKQRLAKLKR